jgi:hypothetical protein
MAVLEGVIDADTHVIESQETWDWFDEDRSLASMKPQLVETVNPADGAKLNRWIIGGQLIPRPDGKGAARLATPPLDDAIARESHYGVAWPFRSLADPIGRAADAERLGVTTQIVYPTIFIADLTDNVALNVALCRSYNRFMSKVWEQGGGKFHWVLVPPLLSVEETVEEIKYGRDHGAVGIMFRGIEGDRSVGDPYFEPIYDEAEKSNLPICFHTGPGCRPLLEMADNRYMRNFGQIRILPLVGFHDICFNQIPQKFPNLRFGFLESSASWAPFLIHFLRREAKRLKEDVADFGPALFQKNRMFIACEVDEDIPYLVNCMGADNILLGSDYGHGDHSTELDIVDKIVDRPDVSEELRRNILVNNPGRFYGLGTA